MKKIEPDAGEFMVEMVKTLGIKPQIYKWDGLKGSGAKVRVPAFEFEYHRDPPPPPPDPIVEKAAERIRDKEERRGSGIRASSV